MTVLLTVLLIISILLILYTYFIYPLCLAALNWILAWWGEKGTSPQEHEQNVELPFVSIIVAAYNEEKVIEEKIHNLSTIHYPEQRYETILASDGSTDRTNELIDKYQTPRIRAYKYSERKGKLSTINRTVPHARGSILVFSDANTIFHSDAVMKLVKCFQSDPAVGAVCGELRLRNSKEALSGEGEGLYWKYEVKIKAMESNLRGVIGANGGIYAIRKELFRPVDDHMIIDDFLIPLQVYKQGHVIKYEQDAVAWEETALTYKDEFKRKCRIGAGNFQSLTKLRWLMNPKYGLISYFFWSHKVVRWFVPFFMIAALISNALLISQPLFMYLFTAHFAFYICSLIGWALAITDRKNKLFNLIFYFVSMNIALLNGFYRFLLNKQKVTWSKAGR